MAYVIGTAGHVDHGKSTLVKALTGIDPDRLAEEKARQMTIDLGFAWLTLPSGISVGIVDVPGHRDFIENMLAGIGGIDLALFIIAADEGVMPQTREHLAILDLLEIPRGVVALTKIDLIDDPDWLDLVMLDVASLLEGTALSGAPILPVSAQSGAGLNDLLAVLDQMLADCPPRTDRGRPRLPVDRVFTISGFGTVVTGTLSGGSLAAGQEVEIVPRGKRARIRGVQSHKESVEVARPGSRVAVNLTGVDKTELRRGDVISVPGLISGTALVDAQFRHLADTGRPLRHNAEVKFFCGSAESAAHVRLVGDRELEPGAAGWLQIRLSEPLALDKGDRFILRYPSPPQTIGGGVLLDPHPPHRWRRFKPEIIRRFETLSIGTPDELLYQALDGQVALALKQASDLAGLSLPEAEEALQRLISRGECLVLPDGWVITQAAWQRMSGRLVQEITAYHVQYPLKSGIPREALRSRLAVEGKLFNALIKQAVEEGAVQDGAAFICLSGHQVAFNDLQQQAVNRLMAVIKANPASPPGVREASELVGEEVLQVLFERQELIQVSSDVFFDARTYHELVGQVEDYITQHGSITVAQARDLFGSSRKYILALLEHLDNTGVTKRVGDERQLRHPRNG